MGVEVTNIIDALDDVAKVEVEEHYAVKRELTRYHR